MKANKNVRINIIEYADSGFNCPKICMVKHLVNCNKLSFFHNNFIIEKMFAAYTPFADKVNKDIRVSTLQLIGCVRLPNGPEWAELPEWTTEMDFYLWS